MNLDAVQSIVDAVLYEGYLLYPYRPSALKNRQRWTFGGVYPKAYSEAQAGAEPCEMQTECLLTGSPETCIGVRVGFLHLVERQPGELPAPVRDWPADAPPEVLIRNTLLVGNKHYYGWQEATERRVESLSYELRGCSPAADRPASPSRCGTSSSRCAISKAMWPACSCAIKAASRARSKCARSGCRTTCSGSRCGSRTRHRWTARRPPVANVRRCRRWCRVTRSCICRRESSCR